MRTHTGKILCFVLASSAKEENSRKQKLMLKLLLSINLHPWGSLWLCWLRHKSQQIMYGMRLKGAAGGNSHLLLIHPWENRSSSFLVHSLYCIMYYTRLRVEGCFFQKSPQSTSCTPILRISSYILNTGKSSYTVSQQVQELTGTSMWSPQPVGVTLCIQLSFRKLWVKESWSEWAL